MKSKFDMIYESNFTRFQGGGFLSGDVIKLKEGWESDDWTSKAPQQLVDQIKQATLNRDYFTMWKKAREIVGTRRGKRSNIQSRR